LPGAETKVRRLKSRFMSSFSRGQQLCAFLDNTLIGKDLRVGGEGGIRTLSVPAESVTYRFHVASIAVDASDAVGPRPILPDGMSLTVRRSLKKEILDGNVQRQSEASGCASPILRLRPGKIIDLGVAAHHSTDDMGRLPNLRSDQPRRHAGTSCSRVFPCPPIERPRSFESRNDFVRMPICESA
jgi:hypothetical protein